MNLWRFTAFALLLTAVRGGCFVHSADDAKDDASCPVAESLRQATKSCKNVKCLVDALRTSPDFADQYWEQTPLLLHVPPSALGDAALKWDDLVVIAEKGLSWAGGPVQGQGGGGGGGFNSLIHPARGNDRRFEGKPMNRNTMDIGLIQSALVMAAVQTLHGGVAQLVLEFQKGLGLTCNGNVYASQQGLHVASSMHTDRMDIFVVQTSGRKRWRVHRPKAEALNPVWGVHGNAEWGKGDRQSPPGIPIGLVGEQLIDTVLKPGDVLYIPRGFPHATSTYNLGEGNDANVPSVAITVATHTEAHHFVYEKVLRCALAKSGFCEHVFNAPSAKAEKDCPIGVELTRLVRSDEGKELRRGLPVGFLNRDEGWFAYAKPLADVCQRGFRELMRIADEKGIDHGGDAKKVVEEHLPTVAGRTFEFIKHDLVEMEKTFAGSDLNKEWPYEKRQELWHRTFSMVGPFQGDFCHEGGPQVFFRDYFSPDLEPDDFSRQLVMTAGQEL